MVIVLEVSVHHCGCAATRACRMLVPQCFICTQLLAGRVHHCAGATIRACTKCDVRPSKHDLQSSKLYYMLAGCVHQCAGTHSRGGS
jgi:hypothetical protein